jgi:hypothetical protein
MVINLQRALNEKGLKQNGIKARAVCVYTDREREK